jgi:hypothetical protein
MNQEQRDRAIEVEIDRERLRRALATTAGFLAEGTHPEWETPEQVSPGCMSNARLTATPANANSTPVDDP